MDSEWILTGPLNHLKQKFRLKEGITKIGRGVNNDIRILKTEVSREHCVLNIQKDKITLLDHGSFNGCYVGKNKIPVKQAWHLSSGDKIGFGIETETNKFSDLIFQIIKEKITTIEINGNNQVEEYEDLLSSDDSDVVFEHAYYIPKTCSVSSSNNEDKVVKIKSNSTQNAPSTSKGDVEHASKACSASLSNEADVVKNKSNSTQNVPSTSKTDVEHASKKCSVSLSNEAQVVKNKSNSTQNVPSTSKTDVEHASKTRSVSLSNKAQVVKNKSNSTQNVPSTSKTDVEHASKTCSESLSNKAEVVKNKSNSTQNVPSTSKTDVEHASKTRSVSLSNKAQVVKNKSNSTQNVPSTSKTDVEHASKTYSASSSNHDAKVVKIKSNFVQNVPLTSKGDVEHASKTCSVSLSNNVAKVVKIKSNSVQNVPSTSKGDVEHASKTCSVSLSNEAQVVKIKSEFTQNVHSTSKTDVEHASKTCSVSLSNEAQVVKIKSEFTQNVHSTSKTDVEHASKIFSMPHALNLTKPIDSSIIKNEYTDSSDFIEIFDSDEEISLSQYFSVSSIKNEIIQDDFHTELIIDDDDDDDLFLGVFSQELSFNDQQKNRFFEFSANQNPLISKNQSTDILISDDKKDPDKTKFFNCSNDTEKTRFIEPTDLLISEDEDPEINDKDRFVEGLIKKEAESIKIEPQICDTLISDDEPEINNDQFFEGLINNESIEPQKSDILISEDKKNPEINYNKALEVKKKNVESTKIIIIEPQNVKKRKKNIKNKPYCTNAEKKRVMESRREKLKELALKNPSSKTTQCDKKVPPIKIVRNTSRSEFLSKENYQLQIKNMKDTIKDNKIKDDKKRKLDEEINNKMKKRKIGKVVTFSKELFQIFEIPAFGKMKKVNRQKEFLTKEPLNLESTKINWAYEITHSNTVHTMCKWSVNWLHECKTISKDPPLLNYPPLRVEDKYNTYDLYKFSMYPLLMSEIWSDIVREKDLQDLNKKDFGVLHGVVEHASNLNLSGKNIVSCRCLMVGDAAMFKNNLTPKYADLSIVQINFPNDSKKLVYNAFSVVSNSPKFMSISQCKDNQFLYFLKSSLQFKNDKSTIEPSGYCCVDLVLHPSLNGPRIENGFLIKLRTVKNINKDLRLAKTIFKIETSSLRQIIINPTEYLPVPELSHKDKLITTLKLNEAQEKAVLCISRSILSKIPSINLVHGPPGTGKSHVIIALIQQILYHTRDQNKRKGMPKILLCTPSNTALDEIVLRLMDIRKNIPNNKFKLIRCGNPDTMNIYVRNVSPQFLALNKVNMDLDQSNVEIELNLLRAKESAYKLACESKTDGRSVEKLSSIQEKIIEFEKLAVNKMCPQNNYLRNKMLIDEENSVIGNAEIIATTLSSCYSKKIVDALSDTKDISFSCCIIDEATQAIEPEVLMPLLHKIDNIVLVGDPCQLPATVCSQTSKNFSFDTSIYHRLYNCWKNNENTPLYRLQNQHRMHPEIADFPSNHFYDGFLKTPSFLETKYPFMPYVVIEHTFLQDSQGEINTKEGQLILEIVYALGNQSIFDEMDLGIIVPYQKQKNVIQNLLKKGEKPKINLILNTIDSFQGKENDIVILSCVRTDGIGFLADKQRINVALTRAKKCLLIVGNFTCLQKNDTWKSLILDAKSRNIYYSLESPNIRDSVQSLIKHITKIPVK